MSRTFRHPGVLAFDVRTRAEAVQALASPVAESAIRRGDRVNVLLRHADGRACVASVLDVGRHEPAVFGRSLRFSGKAGGAREALAMVRREVARLEPEHLA